LDYDSVHWTGIWLVACRLNTHKTLRQKIKIWVNIHWLS
jgi:hypothetical protein